jgi:hypothetical protein
LASRAVSIVMSMEPRMPLGRLSLRLSRSVFESPRTAPWRTKVDAEAGGEPAFGTYSPELPELTALSSKDVLLGDGSLPCISAQLAGVGGTGPRAATPSGGGRRVGGDLIDSLWLLVRETLCDRPVGGGPGGGGGMGIPGSHLADADLDRAEVGVSTAPAETALRAPGGAGSESALGCGGGLCCGIWSVRAAGAGRLETMAMGGWTERCAGEGCESGDVACSGSRLLPKVGRPNRRSLEPVLLAAAPGGGAKDEFTGVSGDGLGATGAGALAADILAAAAADSYTVLTGR